MPLNAEAREALGAWTCVRRKQLEGGEQRALFVSRKGARLSTRAIDLVIRGLARDADVVLSAHTLRHTCLTRLVRGGADVVLVAELAGHRRLETVERSLAGLLNVRVAWWRRTSVMSRRLRVSSARLKSAGARGGRYVAPGRRRLFVSLGPRESEFS